MIENYLVLDIASAPIEKAADYLEPVSAPANYKDPVKIAAYIAEKTAERRDKVATDIDLAQITAIGHYWNQDAEGVCVETAKTNSEAWMLDHFGKLITQTGAALVTYGGHAFDLELLMRRALYLGVDFPDINLDRYKSPHVDLCELLSNRQWDRRRPLSFYIRRLGWTDITKPLDGAEESRVLETGRWDDLIASVRHDVTAIVRLAQWRGIVPTLSGDKAHADLIF